MEIYEALKKDHVEVREMLTQLIELGAETPAEMRNGLINDIRDALVPHSRAEEAVFYNSLRGIEKASGLVAHGYQEHVAAETLLRALQVQGKVDAGWIATAKKLKEALEHHIAEEEGAIFTAAKQVFTRDEARMMGEAFEKLKPEIKEEGLMTTTIELVANIMPARFSKAFSKFSLESRVNN